MRRTLAIALAAGVLLLGGCAKQQSPAVSATVPPAATPAATASSPAAPAASSAHGSTPADGVDDLLDQVDHQLASDDQPAADQD